LKKTIWLVITCVSLLISASAECFASVSDLQKKKDNAKESEVSAKNNLASTRGRLSEAQAELAELDDDLSLVTEELAFTVDELEKTVILLEQTENELELAILDREAQFSALKSRVRYMHENGITGYLSILFKAVSVSDLLNRIDYINQIIAYDNNMLERLTDTENYISHKKDEVGKYKREVEVLKLQQEQKKAGLEDAKFNKESYINQLNRDERKYEQQIIDLQAESKRIEQQIKDAEAEAARAASMIAVYTGGLIGWPLPSSQRMTSPFGNRTNPINRKPEFHTGIDIGASYGANIVAAEGGRVLSAGWSGGYGNTIIITHGNGLSTLYAHCSSFASKAGDTVAKGQIIAKVGSTGFSTGNHLHFEVRMNGAPQNPIPKYVSMK